MYYLQEEDLEEKDETFVPSYATFTPHMSSECLQDMKYKAPERRVPSAVAPPSSVVRPNYHDALRRGEAILPMCKVLQGLRSAGG